MKILWFSHIVPYPPKGGVLQRSHHLLRELAGRNEVHLVSFVQQTPLRLMYGDVEIGLNDCHKELLKICPVVKFLPIPCERSRWGKKLLLLRSLFTVHPYTINWLKSRAMRAEVTALMDGGDYDAVHFDTISLAIYRDLFPQAKCVLNHHNIESHMMFRRASNERDWLAKAYLAYEAWRLQRYERSVCKRFDMHLTCSSLDSDRLSQTAPSLRTAIVPNGVDVDYFKPSGAPRQPNRLVFAGRLSAYPNRRAVLFLAQELWPVLKDALPEMEMDIIGADPPVEIVELSKHDPAFRVHGFVDDVRSYLDSAAVYVCPINDGGGTKLKVLDALAMALPLVAHPVACEGINVAAGQTVLYAASPAEYVAQIRRLVRHADMRRRMSYAARQLAVEQYSYAGIGRGLHAVYENMINKGNAKSRLRLEGVRT